MHHSLVLDYRAMSVPVGVLDAAESLEPSVADKPILGTDEAPRSKLPSLSCVVPCHNEGCNLELLLPTLVDILEMHTRAWEIILVDDGSTDETLATAQRWTGVPGVRCVQLSRNFGKEAALTAGLQEADGEVVVMLDADLQHPPLLIAEFIRHWQAGADVVYAQRHNRDDEHLTKRIGARWFYALMNVGGGFEIPPGAGDFRLMDRAAVAALLAMPERTRFMKGLYAWVGFQAVAVPYVPAARVHGSSRFNLLKLIGLSMDGLTAFTKWPLRAVSIVGTVLAVLAFLYGVYLSIDYLLNGHAVSGWTTIVVSLMLFAGIQMVSLGLVGEYVGRVFEEVKARPLFVVRSRLGRGLKASSK
ncbi:glycosyltransferase family 2 protein [Acidovorax sp. SUPP2522]|uniref:glycosyltransferase family 2 protein n=1 Tax=unclassified Acidovorax TaxID=2684926 RepID=UPI00234923DF|nr:MULTISPECIES: glycosyltransferase family 2 protein [unclassified Acidovorax]WCM96636.1 glycosyltransferase family 2 protein [Acidovorax sp. GBBC 1281]GKT19263.1 glycosyltransferase family 2 protein [Acidovorax sp. SUPP2522]